MYEIRGNNYLCLKKYRVNKINWRFRLRDKKTDCNGHLEVWVHKNDHLSL